MNKEALADPTEPVPQGLQHRNAPERPVPARREEKVGRNEPCPCGSGRKYKKCCLGLAPRAAPASAMSLLPGQRLVEVDGEMLVTSAGVSDEEAREAAAFFQARDRARR
jgi:hypothetical protein